MNFYIDPGTGSMLITIIISLIGTLIYSCKLFFARAKTLFGGKNAKLNNEKIPFVIYSDDKRYWSVFKPICIELDKLDKEILYLTASEDDPVFKQEFKNLKAEYIGKDNKSFFRLNYLSANIVISTTPSLDVFQWKRSKKVDYYVHVLHAAGDVTMYRMFGIDYYDAILLSGEYQVQDIRDLEALRNLPAKELVKIGIPYMDEMTKRLESADPLPNHDRTVLLAPSWGKSAIFGVYGGKIIDELLNTGYHVIVRPHPQSFESEKDLMDELMTKYPESEQLEWNRDTDNFDVLRRADILISDFSGVILDFALVYGKPVIYTDPNFDLGPYDAWWLKRPIWTVTALERMGYQLSSDNLGELKSLIDDCLTNPKFAEKLKEIKAETWEYPGEGTNRAIEFLKNKQEEILKKAQEEAIKLATKQKKNKKNEDEQLDEVAISEDENNTENSAIAEDVKEKETNVEEEIGD